MNIKYQKLKMQSKKQIKKICYRPTWAEIDLSAIDFNFRQVKSITGKQTKVMAVIKCDAYGHGLLPVARRLIGLGADYLGVASIDEAIALRKEKVKLPVLVLGNTLNEHTGPIVKYGLTQAVSDYKLASKLSHIAKREGKFIKVHIKVDTGMGRLGVLYREAIILIKKIKKLDNLTIEGLFTHFPCADSDSEFTSYQIEIFKQLISDLKKCGITVPICHAANSMGLIGYPESHFNLVRPGLMLFGIYPKRGLNIKLRPAFSLKTKAVFLKDMPSGQGISYGRNYITRKQTTVAVLSIGYGDGYPRNLSNRADVLIKGRRFVISGAICMDYIMVDIGNLPAKTGEEIVLIGSQAKIRISAEELAQLSGTIAYEIVCGIGSRVPRVYLS